MDETIISRIEELAILQKDLQNVCIKIDNPGNVIPATYNSSLKRIVNHIELQRQQIQELKEKITKLDYAAHEYDASGKLNERK